MTLKSKLFDTLAHKRKKQTVKRMKKACKTRWLSLDAGVDAAWEEFGGLIDALKVIEKDKTSCSTSTGLLRKINNYEFLGTICLLKNMLPILSCLVKTFQTGSLNFSRITPSINKCIEKIKEVAKNGKVLKKLRDILNGKLKESAVTLNETAEARIQVLFINTSSRFVLTSLHDLRKIHERFSGHFRFLMWTYFRHHQALLLLGFMERMRELF